MTTPDRPETATDSRPDPIAELVSAVRAGVRLRDGYYLSEELVDLYLVGVLRGVAVGLQEADGQYREDRRARSVRLDELTRTSAELLAQLHRLRPPPTDGTPPGSIAPDHPDPLGLDPDPLGLGPGPLDPGPATPDLRPTSAEPERLPAAG